MAERSTAASSPATRPRVRALVRCDLAALQRGRVEGAEVCEVAGLGPIPVGPAVDLLGQATWKLLVTQGVDVLNVTTLSRRASAAMLLVPGVGTRPFVPPDDPRHPSRASGDGPSGGDPPLGSSP